MEEDPFPPSKQKMTISPLSDFKPMLEDDEYMELVWENGQILTKGRRSNDCTVGSTQNPRKKSFLDLYEAEYFDVLKHNTSHVSDMTLGDPQVVPVRQNPCSNAVSPPCPDGVLAEESDKSKKEKGKLSMVITPQAVEIAGDNKIMAIKVEPKTERGLPDHDEVLEKQKEIDVSQDTNGGQSMKVVDAMADQMNQKNVLHPKEESAEYSLSDAQSVAMERSLDTVGMEEEEEEEENESSDLLSWSTELCSASSFSSQGTSEDHMSSPDTIYEESEGSTQLSDDNSYDESDDAETQFPKTAKRKLSEDFDELSEREGRRELNKRLRDLQKLLPECDKDDKASLLDEAIKYMRKLQLQIQLRLMSPQLMFPMGHYSPVGLGIATPPFVPPLLPSAALCNQPGLMPLSYFSSDPIDSLSQQSVQSASSMEFERSATMSSSEDSVHTNGQEAVDKPSEPLQMPHLSEGESENPPHFDSQSEK